MSRKMMLVTFMVLPFLAARPVLAQDTLKLDLGKALEIALSENPTVKVADKEIQKKKYARKGSYASLFPQISFAGDYNRTLKKQVMYMDFDMGDMGGGSLPEGTDMSSMDEGFEVGRSSLTGLYQWSAMNNDFKFKNYRWNPYSMIGITLSVPIFSGGSKFYKVKQTKVSIDQLNLQRDDTKRNLQLAVKQYIDNMNTCIKKFDAAQKGVEQAERGYMISQKRYDTGAGTWLEMNDAELALTQARLNFNQSIYDYMVAKADLEKVLGNEQMN